MVIVIIYSSSENHSSNYALIWRMEMIQSQRDFTVCGTLSILLGFKMYIYIYFFPKPIHVSTLLMKEFAALVMQNESMLP